MALYVGEIFRVISRFDDFNGAAITDASDATVVVDIFNDADTKVVEAQTMAWDATGNSDGPYWYYSWDTAAATAGKYKSRATATGTGLKTFAFGDIKLVDPPVSD